MTSDTINGPYSLPFKLLDAAEELVLATKEKRGAFPPTYYIVLLSSLERIIDASRGTVEPGSGGKYPEDKAKVEQRLGVLRVTIAQLAKTCTKEDLRNELESFADRMHRHFISES